MSLDICSCGETVYAHSAHLRIVLGETHAVYEYHCPQCGAEWEEDIDESVDDSSEEY